MSRRKGLSMEEKRTRMLQIFHESEDFYQLKELEKIAPKEKGIITQSVKEVVQSLVDDGLVYTDKIGTSLYYWSYPSELVNLKRRKLEELNTKIGEANKKQTRTTEKINESTKDKEAIEYHRKLLEEVGEMMVKCKKLVQKIDKIKENDPEIYQQMLEASEVAKQAANRWTDNIFSIKLWCKRKFSIEASALDKQFEIPPDLDYIS